ncbi:MAG TPA: hypothetical protein ENJ90_10300 [Devosia sp.]|nr:hypothetical protein [Devosia sp.]
MRLNVLTRAVLAGAAVFSLGGGAFAQDARDFADKFAEAIRIMAAVDVQFGSATADGDTIVLSGISIPTLDSKRGAELLDRTLTFVGVTETPEGGYRAESATFDDLDYTAEGVNLVVNNVVFTDIRIAAEPGADVLETMLLYQGLSAGPVSVTIGGDEVFAIDSITVDAEYDEAENTYLSSYAIDGIYGDLSKIEDRDATEFLDAFGLSQLNARLDGNAMWYLDDGRMDISESSVTIQNLGKLNFAVEIGGYTLELMEQIQETSQEMAKIDPSSSEYEARSMQMMMGMVSGLTLNSASIRFDDDSLTTKFMEFVMEEEGITRKEFISGVANMAPQMLSMLGAPALEAQISRAVVAYLKDPQSFEISVNPDQAVQFLVLAGGLANPAVAIELLNLQVTANE